MKKEIPVPAVIGAVVLLIAVAVFALMNFTGPREFPAVATEKVIPDYIFNGMPKAEQDKMKAQGYKIVSGSEIKQGGQPSAAPTK